MSLEILWGRELDNRPQITIWEFRRQGFLNYLKEGRFYWGVRGSFGKQGSINVSRVVLDGWSYFECSFLPPDSSDGEMRVNQRIYLVTTPGNFGGKRYWFVCPRCINRKGALYLRGDEAIREEVRTAGKPMNSKTLSEFYGKNPTLLRHQDSNLEPSPYIYP